MGVNRAKRSSQVSLNSNVLMFVYPVRVSKRTSATGKQIGLEVDSIISWNFAIGCNLTGRIGSEVGEALTQKIW